MQQWRRSAALAAVSTLVLGGLTGPAAAAPAAPDTTRKRPSSVTLITGDRVTLAGRSMTVQPGPGREKINFLTETLQGHQYVTPADALAPLRAGKLDQRLFDVTELAAIGADRTLPLLVSYPKGGAPAATSSLAAGDATVTRDIAAVRTLAVKADTAGRQNLWAAVTAGSAKALTLRPTLQKIWLDGRRTVSLDVSVPQIGAPAAWQAGYDGTGVTVAVLDSGIDATHPDLKDRIVEAVNFSDTPSADDTVGHGTHVASIIAGSGAASDGRYQGVAPGAKLLIGKVCGTTECADSAILAGMAWAAPRAPVINMSLGAADTPDIDPIEQAVNDLTAQYETLFVVAAGNDGATGTIGSPSSADAALSVGAVDSKDQLAEFSSRGPRTGDDALKPDITAPGVSIVAAKAVHGRIGTSAPVDGYTTISGTSMATPHVAGAAAILTQLHPEWSSKLRKNTLMASAQPAAGVSAYDQGAGRVDVAREITQTVSADEGSLSFGLRSWPHADDEPVARTITYRNSGTEPVELALSTPGAPFTVAAKTLTVPAGGTASTMVTADTRSEALPAGRLTANLTATGAGGLRVTTPLGLVQEPESYDYRIRVVNRDGTPSTENVVMLFSQTSDRYWRLQPVNGETTLRLPKDEYGLYGWVLAEGETTQLAESVVTVEKAGGVTLDARRAKPVTITVPEAGARSALTLVSSTWTGDAGSRLARAGIVGRSFDGTYVGSITGISAPNFSAEAYAGFGDPGPENTFNNSRYSYDLAYTQQGRMFDGLVRAPRKQDLAAFQATYAAEATDTWGSMSHVPMWDEYGSDWRVFLTFDLPFQRTEYVNPDVPWKSFFEQNTEFEGFLDTTGDASCATRRVRAGRTYPVEWNRGVFAPSVAGPEEKALWVTRQGDLLSVSVPMVSEGTGHTGNIPPWFPPDVALYRGTAKLDVDAPLPPEPADYRLEVTAARPLPHTLSTEVSGVWTFRSGHVGGDGYQRLPLSTVRISPRLDDRNRAPAGRLFEIPLTVEHQPGSGAATARSVRAEVSYDDGGTWQRAELRGQGDHRIATVRHPQGAGFASLRVTATDARGNAVTETVIRAYALG